MKRTINAPMMNSPTGFLGSGRIEVGRDDENWKVEPDGERVFRHAVHLEGYMPRVAPDVTVSVVSLEAEPTIRWSADAEPYLSRGTHGPARDWFYLTIRVRGPGGIRHIGLKWVAQCFCRPGEGG